ncbi:MAG: hypothetical protein ACD_7C00387G0002 [uncultured bacterium]|nr:MAG: hypothetical protein ACD_7C00387G0002 [uncultured bacterium]KKP68712.1 MAG: hypothetical protein UR66_C0004G0112 [Candidatus Moranbacteria bacterium GW2011_GWE1_35_17]KKP81399.1 MAG: hypothetical protein UR82_C0065G0006 [Candidatus Moranbacteria bacterium GW2011_GWF1_35_5]KKP84785.1 MAG: hypothetical protein UR83_C0012G0008 [Candidatus Moranbacteria bacterium GW2011_GWF2_35_54]HBR79188.1 hypothetical protein [Candidatus Moranbacteria bacterium]
MNESLLSLPMLIWIIPLAIWDIAWKGYAMWRAGKNDQLGWFITVLILNTAGILPIIYLIFFQKNSNK